MTSRPALSGAAGALVIAFSAILVRLAHVSPETAAVFRCVYALPALGLLAWIERRRYGPRGSRDRLVALSAGVFFAIDLICWHHSIAAVGAGLATVLANVQVVLVGVLAWLLLGERPERRAFISVPVVLAGVVLISGVVGAGAYGKDPVLGVVYGLATALGLLGLPADPAPRQHRPAPAGGAAVRRHAQLRGGLPAGGLGDRHARPGARSRGAGLADHAGAVLAGARLAPDLGVAAAAARAAHLDHAHHPAGGLGAPRRGPAERAPLGCSAGGRGWWCCPA